MANLQTVDAPGATSSPLREEPPQSADAYPLPPRSERGRTRQLAVTIVARVKPAQVPRLKRVLRTIGQDPAGNAIIPFGALSRTHFARLVALEATKDLSGAPIEPQLIYLADVDAPLDRHLEELVDVAGPGLDRVFGACVGYPAGRRISRKRRLAFLSAHMVGTAAMYVNTVGRSALQIRQEAELHDAIERFLDEAEGWAGREPGEVRAAIQDFVNTQDALAWARGPLPPASVAERLTDATDLLRPLLGLLALSPVLVPALPLWAVLVLLHELRDEADDLKPDEDHVMRLAALEDHFVQNQFSAVGLVKPGLVRRLTTEGVTRAIDFSARHVFNHANLAGVKSIHFARWVFLDDHRRLIFASNYDGSLESYMDDFIDKVWWGLNAVFSNGFGYPRTRLLFLGGAKDEQAFKDYLRRHQVPTQVWYSAYPHLSALNIDNNARIRAGLYGDISREEAEKWLSLI